MRPPEFDDLLIKNINRIDQILQARYNKKYDADITSDVILTALENADKWDGKCKISTWMIGIAKNIYLFKAKYKKNHPQETNIKDTAEYCLQENNIDLQILIKHIKKLSQLKQSVIEDLQLGLKNSDLAKKYNKNPDAMKTYIYKIRKSIKAQVF